MSRVRRLDAVGRSRSRLPVATVLVMLSLAACTGDSSSGTSDTVVEPSVPPTAAATTAPHGATDPTAPTASSEVPSTTTTTTTTTPAPEPDPRPAPVEEITTFEVPAGSRPHDVAPAPDGSVWYTGQRAGALGRLDPGSGTVDEVLLGSGSAPHGVIVGPDGDPWITDGGLNAIVRVDASTLEVEVFPLPGPDANLNTAVFDPQGRLWFTGQNGYFGWVDPDAGEVGQQEAPGGRGPYGITATPQGQVFYASLAGSHIARIDTGTAEAHRIDPPTPGQGARRVWSDSSGAVWVSEWDAGQLGRFDPSAGTWSEWPLPGEAPQAYAVYVDDEDDVWISDFSGDGAIHRFDPDTERFETFPLPVAGGDVRQLLGRPGEVWGALSAVDALMVIRTG